MNCLHIEASHGTNALSARQPLGDDRVEGLWVLYVAEVSAGIDQLEGGAGDEPGHLLHDGGGRSCILSAANEEGWAFDPAEMALVVELLEGAGASDIASRARRKDHASSSYQSRANEKR